GEVAKFLLTAIAKLPARNADHDRFRFEPLGQPGERTDDIAFVGNHRVRSRQDSRIAHCHTDAPGAIIDGHDGHRTIVAGMPPVRLPASGVYNLLSQRRGSMKNFNLDAILEAMLKISDRVSDLNFSVGRPPQVEVDGQLVSVNFPG